MAKTKPKMLSPQKAMTSTRLFKLLRSDHRILPPNSSGDKVSILFQTERVHIVRRSRTGFSLGGVSLTRSEFNKLVKFYTTPQKVKK